METVDYRGGPDLPSHLTLGELRVVHVFAERFAAELDGDAETEVQILVRDRGRDGVGMTAPWVEFAIEGRQFALWRHNLDLYEIGPDGTVGDEPLHSGRA